MQNKKETKFVVGLTASQPPDSPQTPLNAWMEIQEGNRFAFFIPRAEMGQGVYTALTTLICEELDIDPNGGNVTVTHPSALMGIYTNYGMLEDSNIEVEKEGIVSWMAVKVLNKYPLIVTGGSSSVLDAWKRLRLTGARTRWQFLAAAAGKWDVPVEECRTEDGLVKHDPSGRSLGYFDLAEDACKIVPPQNMPLKKRDDFKYIGKDIKRLDIPSKVDGSAVFGIDLEMAGMLYAAVLHAPVLGEIVANIDAADAEALPGVEKIIYHDNWVAAVADSFWTAKKAVAKVNVTYRRFDSLPVYSEKIRQFQEETLEKKRKKTVVKTGDFRAHRKKGGHVLREIFRTPYLAHAPMEPLSATALYENGTMQIWQSSQSSTVMALAANRAAKAAKVKLKEVVPHVSMLGGGFGLKGEIDVPFQAAYLALQCPGIPVKLIWPREEDIRQDKYRPGVISRFEVGLDEKGFPRTWSHEIAGQSLIDSLMKRSFGLPVKTGRLAKYKLTTEGAAQIPYAIPNQKIQAAVFEAPVQIGFWRSVGHSNNAFFVESMIDMCAEAAGIDPLEYRKALLKDQPRLLNVAAELEAMSNWRDALAENQAKGVGLWHSFQSNIGVTAVAALDPEKKTITIPRVYCVVDCGTAIQPDNIVNQMEGSVLFALSAFYFGEITLEDGKVVQSNYNDYQMAKLSHTPEIEVKIIESDERPGGMGEPGVPASLAALANAVSKVAGKRITELPVTKMGLKPGSLV
jgi:isoquinoline 1-oxidoreductase beta subunit